MAEIIGKAIGHAANGVIEVLDVDGVVRKVDINDVLERIDMDALVERIDVNKVLERVDIDKVVSRVNVNEVIMRSNVPSILAHSTTGIVTEVLDSLRKQVVLIDLWLMDVAGWLCRREVAFQLHVLPPGPGAVEETSEKPQGRSKIAVAIQDRYTGIVSKGLAFLIDSMFITFSFAGLLIMVEASWMILMKNDQLQEVGRDNVWAVVVYCIYWFLYFFSTTLLMGRTIGMSIVGIKVVDKDTSDSLEPRQAFLRTLLLPLSSTVAVILGLIGFFRRDGRMLHDLAAGTGLIYKWDASMAQFREEASTMKPVGAGVHHSSHRLIESPLLPEGGANNGVANGPTSSYSTFRDASGAEAVVFEGTNSRP